MNINIYEDYAIRYTVNSRRLSEENETKYDNLFNDDEFKTLNIINGVQLMDLISNNLTDDYISEFVIIGKELHFEKFNYNNGESESICIEILGSGKHESK